MVATPARAAAPGGAPGEGFWPLDLEQEEVVGVVDMAPDLDLGASVEIPGRDGLVDDRGQ